MDIKESVPLTTMTSLHVGGPATYVARVTNDEELAQAVTFAKEKKLPFFVLGKGSNTLFPDEGYAGVIIHMSNRRMEYSDTAVTVEAGMFMRLFVTKCHEQGITGFEELAGIPGTIGGAVRGNAGTWNTEIKDVLETVTVYRPTSEGVYEFVEMKNKECEFGYRHSIFKLHPDWIIVRATLQGARGNIEEAKKAVMHDLEQRHTKQPYDAPSAGSVFKNPNKAAGIYSGKLIEAVGLKGFQSGGAEISPKHGNFIVNRGNATADDIMTLITTAQREVKKKFSIDLQPEIEIVRLS